MTTEKTFPEALAHGDIREVFSDIYFVTGTFAMAGRMPMRFSRNMVIVRENGELTLINSVRLGEDGLAQLDALGTVKNVIRLAGFHGMDDPFYKQRYGAKVWSVDAPYASGISRAPKAEDIYFQPDVVVDASTELPLKDAKLIAITSCKPCEGLLLLQREQGIVVAGDCLQNWHKTDRYFSFFAKIMMPIMGFIKAHNIGPGWLKFAAPETRELKGILEFDFEHVLPAHGAPVIGGAKAAYKPAFDRL